MKSTFSLNMHILKLNSRRYKPYSCPTKIIRKCGYQNPHVVINLMKYEAHYRIPKGGLECRKEKETMNWGVFRELSLRSPMYKKKAARKFRQDRGANKCKYENKSKGVLFSAY